MTTVHMLDEELWIGDTGVTSDLTCSENGMTEKSVPTFKDVMTAGDGHVIVSSAKGILRG